MKGQAIRNGLWNASANVVGAVSGILSSVLIVRSLSPELYGMFSYYLWLAGIISTLGALTFPVALTKIGSELRGRGQETEAQALSRWVIIVLVGINLIGSIGVLIWAFNRPFEQQIYLLLIAAYLVPNAVAAAIRSSLWGSERYRPVSVIQTATSLIQLGLIVSVALLNWSVLGFVAASLCANVIQSVGLALALKWPFRRQHSAGSRFPSPETLRRYFAFFAPATLCSIFTMIVWERSEVFFLERWSTLDQVGYYNLAYTAFLMFLGLGGALMYGFYPSISADYGAGAWDGIRKKVHQGVILSALYAVPLSFGGWVTLTSLVGLLYGDKMLPAGPVIQILFIGLLPGVMASLLGSMVGAVGGIWLSVRLGAAMSVVNIALNLLLVPRFGAIGGALANTGSQTVYVALLVITAGRMYRLDLPWRFVGGITAIGALTTLLLPELLKTWWPGIWGLLAAIGLAGGMYLTAVWSLGYLGGKPERGGAEGRM
jgi:O-antigen/teichoic acid export membrane protein